MMTKERELLAHAGLIIAKYRWNHPEDQGLQRLSQQINEHLEENQQRKPMTEEEIEDIYYSGITFVNSYLAAFVKGFRQAEKHHGIVKEEE